MDDMFNEDFPGLDQGSCT